MYIGNIFVKLKKGIISSVKLKINYIHFLRIKNQII